MENKVFTFDRTIRLCITVVVLVLLFLLIRRLSGVLLPFVVSWFIAYLIYPIVIFFQDKLRLKNRVLSVFVVLTLLIGLFIGLFFIFAPRITQEFARLSTMLANYKESGVGFLPEAWITAFYQWLEETDIEQLTAQINFTTLWDKIMPYISDLFGSASFVLIGIFSIFVCFLYLVFILIDYETLNEGMREIIPLQYRDLVGGIFHDLKEGMNKYFRGQALIAMSVGVLFSIGFSIIGLPLAIVVGVFIGALNMIPYMQALGIPICLILGLLQSLEVGTPYWIILLGIVAVFLIVQGIQDMFLNPLIMGNIIGMNPALMLLSISIWGSLLGVAGMIIALPITTIIISYYKRYVLKKT